MPQRMSSSTSWATSARRISIVRARCSDGIGTCCDRVRLKSGRWIFAPARSRASLSSGTKRSRTGLRLIRRSTAPRARSPVTRCCCRKWVLNLLRNAIDAVSDMPLERRRITVTTAWYGHGRDRDSPRLWPRCTVGRPGDAVSAVHHDETRRNGDRLGALSKNRRSTRRRHRRHEQSGWRRDIPIDGADS